MSKTAIIYYGKTGFTQRYAQWIAEKTDCILMPLENCNKKRYERICDECDTVVFGTRLRAGQVQKLSKAKKMFFGKVKRFIVFTTGAAPAEAPETQTNMKKIWEQALTQSEQKTIPHFYMPAGLCYEKMPGFEKMMMKGFNSMMKKRDPEAAKITESSFDISDKKYIEPLLALLTNKK